MRAALRAAMVGLVLVDLGFVALIESTSWKWLVPLFLLTVLSPRLVRGARFLVYRALWNVVIVAAFALLCRHVQRAGVAFLLQDGLLLAALSQVHLICNLRDEQKPDLLFFNSFIIAVVTSYLTPDFGYLLLLLLYAPLLLAALHLLVWTHHAPVVRRPGARRSRAARDAAPVLPRAVLAASVRRGVVRGLLVFGLTLLVFLFWPRDFERRGLLKEHLLRSGRSLLEVDFDRDVDLGRDGTVTRSDRVAFRVELRHGTASQVPTYWRGATQDHFDGGSWRSEHNGSCEDPWMPAADGSLVRGDGRGGVELEVSVESGAADAVFAPLESRRLQALQAVGAASLQPLVDLTLLSLGGRLLRYRLVLTAAAESPGGSLDPAAVASRGVHLEIDPRVVPAFLPRRAEEILARLPRDAEQHQIVEALRRDVRDSHRYVLPGEEGAARSLREFVEGPRSGGHCEYFATALCLMLRWEGIPCRLVTGYRSTEWDGAARTLVVRARHAHAWVEVWDPRAGWCVVDPTPAQEEEVVAGRGFLARLREAAATRWSELTAFNRTSRARALQGLRSVGAAVQQSLRGAGGFAVAALLVLLGLLRHRRRMRDAPPPSLHTYRRLLRRLGLALRPGETPRELLARARAGELAPERLRALAYATLAHEHERYRYARRVSR